MVPFAPAYGDWGALRLVVWLLGDDQPPTLAGSATLLLDSNHDGCHEYGERRDTLIRTAHSRVG